MYTLELTWHVHLWSTSGKYIQSFSTWQEFVHISGQHRGLHTHTQDLVVSYLHTGLVRVWLHTTQKQPSALPKASVTVSIIYLPRYTAGQFPILPPPWIHPVTHSYDTGLASYANSCMRVHFQVLTVWLLHITSLGFVHARVVSRACTWCVHLASLVMMYTVLSITGWWTWHQYYQAHLLSQWCYPPHCGDRDPSNEREV